MYLITITNIVISIIINYNVLKVIVIVINCIFWSNLYITAYMENFYFFLLKNLLLPYGPLFTIQFICKELLLRAPILSMTVYFCRVVMSIFNVPILYLQLFIHFFHVSCCVFMNLEKTSLLNVYVVVKILMYGGKIQKNIIFFLLLSVYFRLLVQYTTKRGKL